MANSVLSKLVSVGVVVGIAMFSLVGCSAETADEADGEEGVGTSADALSGLGPCPVCTSTSCFGTACIGTRKGATGCTENAITKTSKPLKPESFIQSTQCTDWWDGSGGEGYVYSRQCTQFSYSGAVEVGVCTPINKKPGTQGPSINQWFYTVSGETRVKRSRGETETNFINPTSTAQPWSSWKKY